MKYALSEVRKTVIGLVGFAVAVLAAFLTIGPDVIPHEWLPWVQIAVAVGTTYGIYQIPNQPAPGQLRKPGVSEVADPVGDIPPDTPTRYDPGP